MLSDLDNLIKHGLDVNLQNTEGQTVLHYAARHLPQEYLALLLTSKGKISLNFILMF